MMELAAVAAEARALRERGVPFLLATVVRVTGSAYRRPGARMLVAEDRWLAGCVSGGCLERDIVRRGAFRTRRGPIVVTYDGIPDEDGLGSGCDGVVEILIERIDPGTAPALDPTAFASACLAGERRGVLATVFESTDPAVPIGARLALDGPSTIAPGLVRDALSAAAAAAERTHVYARAGIAALVEVIRPPPHLFVVGSRHDALPLVRLARSLGFDVTVADARVDRGDAFVAAGATHLLPAPPSGVRAAIDARAEAAVVVMTHDYARDRAYLVAALESRAAYIGVLGARARTSRLVAELGAGRDERVHAPVGLDLGAETPEEIALAIVAETKAALAGASARPLRDRRGAIHEPRPHLDMAGE